MPATDETPEPSRLPEPWRRHAARVHYSNAAAQASDYARALVPVIGDGDDDVEPGEYIQQARRMKVWALEVMSAAVLAERARGCSWQQVAAAFGYGVEFVRARWEPVERAWLAGRPVEIDGLVLNLVAPPTNDREARKVATELDGWCRRNRAPISTEGAQALHPVSYGVYGE